MSAFRELIGQASPDDAFLYTMRIENGQNRKSGEGRDTEPHLEEKRELPPQNGQAEDKPPAVEDEAAGDVDQLPANRGDRFRLPVRIQEGRRKGYNGQQRQAFSPPS